MHKSASLAGDSLYSAEGRENVSVVGVLYLHSASVPRLSALCILYRVSSLCLFRNSRPSPHLPVPYAVPLSLPLACSLEEALGRLLSAQACGVLRTSLFSFLCRGGLTLYLLPAGCIPRDCLCLLPREGRTAGCGLACFHFMLPIPAGMCLGSTAAVYRACATATLALWTADSRFCYTVAANHTSWCAAAASLGVRTIAFFSGRRAGRSAGALRKAAQAGTRGNMAGTFVCRVNMRTITTCALGWLRRSRRCSRARARRTRLLRLYGCFTAPVHCCLYMCLPCILSLGVPI